MYKLHVVPDDCQTGWERTLVDGQSQAELRQGRPEKGRHCREGVWFSGEALAVTYS